MSPFALSLLKYSLLALLYLFVFTAIRSVAAGASDRRQGATSRARTRARAAGPPSPSRPASGGRPPTQVVVHDGAGGEPTTVRLSGQMDVGRGEGCAIRLRDNYVSQVHARLYERDGAWRVEDLGSTNGTFLNESSLSESAVVHEGDSIRLGQTRLELRR